MALKQTIDQLARESALALGESPDDLSVMEQFRRWTVDVVERALSYKSWPFPITTGVSGTASVGVQAVSATLPGPLSRPLEVYDEDNKFPLTEIGAQEATRRWNADDSSDQGRPTHWSWDVVAGVPSLSLWPVPDGTYNYRISIRTNFDNTVAAYVSGFIKTQGDNYLPFPADFYPVLRDGVRWQFREHAEDYAGAERAKGDFYGGLEILASRHLSLGSSARVFAPNDLPNQFEFPVPRVTDVTV